VVPLAHLAVVEVEVVQEGAVEAEPIILALLRLDLMCLEAVEAVAMAHHVQELEEAVLHLSEQMLEQTQAETEAPVLASNFALLYAWCAAAAEEAVKMYEERVLLEVVTEALELEMEILYN
jgi:hypothetical protein